LIEYNLFHPTCKDRKAQHVYEWLA
jgi:hypothetical protein